MHFPKKKKNEDTYRKTLHDLKIFKELLFLESWDEPREIENISPVELLKTNIKAFVLAVSIFFLYNKLSYALILIGSHL